MCQQGAHSPVRALGTWSEGTGEWVGNLKGLFQLE